MQSVRHHSPVSKAVVLPIVLAGGANGRSGGLEGFRDRRSCPAHGRRAGSQPRRGCGAAPCGESGPATTRSCGVGKAPRASPPPGLQTGNPAWPPGCPPEPDGSGHRSHGQILLSHSKRSVRSTPEALGGPQIAGCLEGGTPWREDLPSDGSESLNGHRRRQLAAAVGHTMYLLGRLAGQIVTGRPTRPTTPRRRRQLPLPPTRAATSVDFEHNYSVSRDVGRIDGWRRFPNHGIFSSTHSTP